MYAWNASGSWVKKSRVVASTRLEIQVGLEAFLVEEKFMVLR